MAPDRSTVIVNEPPMAGPCWLRASMEAVLALPHDAIGISCAHGIHMRTFSCLSFIGPTAAALLSLLPLPVRAATPDHAVFRIEVVAGARISEGTCVLVQQENRGGDSVLYFLASARLFTGWRRSTEVLNRAGFEFCETGHRRSTSSPPTSSSPRTRKRTWRSFASWQHAGGSRRWPLSSNCRSRAVRSSWRDSVPAVCV